MSVRYTARMQFRPGQDSETILRELLNLCEVGRIDEIMFFAFAEEQNDGHDALSRIQTWMDTIRPWKQALETRGVEVSLNPWHSMLHTDRGRRFKSDQPWQPMVDWRGRAATAVVCPLDPQWRAYYAEAMRIFARERFRVVWVDDDIRYHNHAPLDWGGCWCPLHVEAFNRHAGVTATRETIIANVLQPGTPHPWRKLWFEMWDTLHCDLIASWRDIVEAEGTRLGLMSSNVETHSAEGRDWKHWWQAMATKHPPVHRPHFWGYSEGQGPILIYGLSMMQQHRQLRAPGAESDPEIECFTYGPWNKSFRHTLAQMSVAQVFGSDRLAISLYDFMGNLPGDEPERAQFLGRVKPMLDWLGNQFGPEWQAVGIGTPWHPEQSSRAHLATGSGWHALITDTRGWDQWLGAFGFAFQKHPHENLNALAGNMAWTFDDATLRTWLSRGLLLDGPAAAILVERGFAELIGLDSVRFITQDDVLYSMEESLDTEFGLRPGAQMSINADKPYKDRLLQGRLHDNAHPISRLLDPLQHEVGHGGFVFENAMGGRVAVMPWDATSGTNLCTQRRAQLLRVLEWLARDISTGRVDNHAWLTPLFLTDGTTWRGVVWNTNPDAVTELTVVPPAGMEPIQNAVQCDADGVLTKACVHDNRITFAKPLHAWECVVLNPSDDNF